MLFGSNVKVWTVFYCGVRHSKTQCIWQRRLVSSLLCQIILVWWSGSSSLLFQTYFGQNVDIAVFRQVFLSLQTQVNCWHHLRSYIISQLACSLLQHAHGPHPGLVSFGITNADKQTQQSVLANFIYLKDGNIEVDCRCLKWSKSYSNRRFCEIKTLSCSTATAINYDEIHQQKLVSNFNWPILFTNHSVCFQLSLCCRGDVVCVVVRQQYRIERWCFNPIWKT